MRKFVTIGIIILSVFTNVTNASNIPDFLKPTSYDNIMWKGISSQCENVKETDYPTIFIPSLSVRYE